MSGKTFEKYPKPNESLTSYICIICKVLKDFLEFFPNMSFSINRIFPWYSKFNSELIIGQQFALQMANVKVKPQAFQWEIAVKMFASSMIFNRKLNCKPCLKEAQLLKFTQEQTREGPVPSWKEPLNNNCVARGSSPSLRASDQAWLHTEPRGQSKYDFHSWKEMRGKST